MTDKLRAVGERLVVEHASAVVVAALRTSGVRSILLKGPLQQAWLALAGPQRSSIDVDVLVAREDVQAAERAIETVGLFRAVELPNERGFEHASVWVAPGRVPVEVHWSLVGANESLVWEVLSAETEPAIVGGESVEILNEAARCLIVALHVAQHGLGNAAILDDLRKALVVAREDRWRTALGLARALDAETPFAAALCILPDTAQLQKALGLRPPALTERQALSLLTPAPAARGFYFLSREPGVRAKSIFLAHKLVPGPGFMRLRYQIANRGAHGLALAYLYRPLWLVRWSIPGFRSWRRARKLARASR
jgi:Uncharacterised nucleotidyltransferase